MKLDEKSEKILEMLKIDAKMTTSQISKKTGIPITTVHNRIKKLENSGIIKGYTVILDHKILGEDILVYILATVNYNVPGKKISQGEIAAHLKKNPAVEEVNILTGMNDMIIKARFSSISQLNSFITKSLRNINGIDKTQTMVVIDEI